MNVEREHLSTLVLLRFCKTQHTCTMAAAGATCEKVERASGKTKMKQDSL